MKIITTTSAAGLIASSIAAGGCVVAVGNSNYPGPDSERYYVDQDEMRSLVNQNKQLRVGMTKGEALAIYPSDLTTLMSSAKVGETIVEEWRVRAYEGSRKHVKNRFDRWLYFSDGKLARFSEDRIEYADNPAIVESWQ
jgi:hypothetical protein